MRRVRNQMVLTSIITARPVVAKWVFAQRKHRGYSLAVPWLDALPPKERCKPPLTSGAGKRSAERAGRRRRWNQRAARKTSLPKCGTAMDSYLIDPKRSCMSVVITTNPRRLRDRRGLNSALKVMTARSLSVKKCGSEMQPENGAFLVNIWPAPTKSVKHA